MTVQVIKTKAEALLGAELANRLADARQGATAAHRSAAAAEFSALGLPHRRIEEWKFTDLRSLIKEALPTAAPSGSAALAAAEAEKISGVEADTYILIDGRLAARDAPGPLEGVIVSSFRDELNEDPRQLELNLPGTIDVGQRSILALNTALAEDGAVIKVTAGTKAQRPIHVIHVATGTVATRTLITIEAGSEATIVESHLDVPGCTRHENSAVVISIGDGAKLDHGALVGTTEGSVHLANAVVTVGRGALYRPFQLVSGKGLARQQTTLTFEGEHSTFDFAAAALVGGTGHSDTTLVVDHKVPHCTSRELFKTVLDDSARGVFQGKVIVRPHAQKTDGKQMAQGLLLSGTAEFDSKPELEIFADDVICGHGSTSAEIDPDLIFYCRSRGIPEAEARALLIESFVGEAVERIRHGGLREAVMARAVALLRHEGT